MTTTTEVRSFDAISAELKAAIAELDQAFQARVEGVEALQRVEQFARTKVRDLKAELLHLAIGETDEQQFQRFVSGMQLP